MDSLGYEFLNKEDNSMVCIKCKSCGLVYDNENSDIDTDSIEKTGKCDECNKNYYLN